VLRKFGSIAVSLLAAGALWVQPTASRAEYPDKPIHLIVPQAAGSATDTVARILAAELSPQLGGQSVIVEDRPGGALTIGIDIVASPRPTATPSASARSARSPSPVTWWRSCPTTSRRTCSRLR
jgi:tripartite-type tricarboxylate transporter receptor subunit TctC